MSVEELRRKARRLEQDIETTLNAFSSLPTTSTNSTSSSGVINGIKSFDGGGSDKEKAIKTANEDVENLLTQLSQLIDEMNSVSTVDTRTGIYIERHNENLQDYRRQHHRALQKHQAQLEHDALLHSSVRPSSHHPQQSTHQSGVSASAAEYDGLYKERGHISGATMGADNVIGVGLRVREDLEKQRGAFKGMMGRIEGMSEGLPGVNRLIAQIRRKKKRDVLIMAFVVAVCLAFTVVYMTR